ncbi:MAG: hypothetical protein AAFV53_00180 [Myxococcota bacterium]
MSKELDQALSQSAGALRKIKAAKGKLQGNFYFAGNKNDSALVVTLASKDPKGAKALKMGKPFRKTLKSPRFARGLVKFSSAKVIFELHKGSASASFIAKSFKNSLSKMDGLSLLRAAVVKTPDQEGTAVEQDAPDEAIQLTPEEEAELNQLVEEQANLPDLGEQIAAFLSEEAFQAELEEHQQREEQISAHLTTLKAQDPRDMNKIRQARVELAKLFSNTELALPGPSGTITEEAQDLLNGALENLRKVLTAQAQASIHKIEAIYKEVIANDTPSWRTDNKAALTTELQTEQAALRKTQSDLAALATS